MKDELEQYIIENKDQFDSYKLDEVDKLKFWSNISNQLPEQPKKVIPIWKNSVFKIAASIIIVLGCSFLAIMFNNNSYENNIVNQELNEIDGYYKSLVNNQIQLIKTSSNLSTKDQEDFLLLVDDLDAEYLKLKNELKEGINNQRIIEAIIANYRKKIQLMENLLDRSYPIKTNFDDGELIL
ncbi:hypothetical protein [Ichthyenterobacterium magnum]|uniref:Anti-sigma factor n=1 Tax=Ichthyenterobacterium magnum TaxID=1230530 RepID=A0A420DX40_9FLAO|nr:hypothetical protein [Ichthyenterobacterium magnum]RKE98810.1 hypothetical protein BXY80_0905 [Ichthyenterobacterium magnum]